MAEKETIESFRNLSIALEQWQSKKQDLIHQSNWGDENLRPSEPDIEKILKMTRDFSELPMEQVENGILQRLVDYLDAVISTFTRISEFSTADIVSNREQITLDIQSHRDAILSIYRAEVPWLAIYSGSTRLWLAEARDEYSHIKDVREKVEQELTKASEAAEVARQKVGEAGAAEFTASFRTQAKSARESSWWWLGSTGIMFVFAAGATVTFVTMHALNSSMVPTTVVEAIVYLGWRIGTVGLLIAAAAWCGRLYRANRHNYEVNQHREACLENMRAFRLAVDDDAVKDMVVLEFSRAATQGMPTGFISGKAEARSDISPQILSLASRRATSSVAQPQS